MVLPAPHLPVLQATERVISDDLSFLISRAVDVSKADYAVVTGVQVGWAGPGRASVLKALSVRVAACMPTCLQRLLVALVASCTHKSTSNSSLA